MIALLVGLAGAAPLREAAEWCGEVRRLSEADRAWCEAPPPGCPALAQACARADREALERAAAPATGCGGEPRSEGPRSASGRAPTKTEPAPLVRVPLDGCSGSVAPAVGGGAVLSGAGGWALLGLLLIAVVVALVRRRRVVADEPEPVGATAAAGEALPVGGAPPNAWLAAAERALREGKLGLALVCARRAVAEALEAQGHVADDPGRTDRELVRIAPEGPLRDELRLLVTVLERVRYAGARVDAAAVRRALDAAAKVVAGTAALLVAAPSWAGPADRDLLVPWLEREGLLVERAEFFADEAVYELWDAGAETSAEDFAAAVAAADGGSRVIVLGSGWLEHAAGIGVVAGEPLAGPYGGVQGLGGRERWPDLRLPDAPLSLVSQEAWPLVVDTVGAAPVIELARGDGYLVLVSTSALLDDASLLHPENADTLAAIFAIPEGATVYVVDRVPVAPSALEQVLATGFGLAFVQLAVLWALWAWASGRAFATRAPLVERPSRELREHLGAVARFYRAAGVGGVAWRAVASRSLHRLRALTRADDAHLVERVAARLDVPAESLRPLLTAALRAATDPPPADPLASSEKLWSLVNRLQATTSAPSPRRSPP